MRVTIKNFKRAGPAAGTLRATADVQLTHSNGKKLLTIREAKVIEGKEGLFVSLPSIKRGERYLHLIVVEDPELENKIKTSLLGHYILSADKKGGKRQ